MTSRSTSVLVIEDNAADFRLLQEGLVDVGAYDLKLAHVASLQTALEALESAPFDVALLDLSLPDADGLDGLTRILQQAPELPVVVITGRNDSKIAIQAVREGAQDYLLKGQLSGHMLVRAINYARERMLGMQRLRRSEERFRALLENALDLIAVVDPKGCITYASPSVERVLGYRPDEFIGRSIADLTHPEDVVRIKEALPSAETSSSSRLECRVRCRDGSWRVLEAVGSKVTTDPIGPGIVVNARDITERKEAEQKLRETNDRLETLIATSPLAIFVLDREGTVLGWNTAAENMFGWTESEVAGQRLSSMIPESGAHFPPELLTGAAGEAFAPVETRYARRDGRKIDVTIWTSLLRDEAGQGSGVIAMVADQTEHRKLEDQFRQAQKMEAIGRLAGGVAHDFNNLLTVITGYSQLAAKKISPQGDGSSELSQVLEAADRAASLTKQLLALSRRQVVAPAIIDLNAVVRDMEGMIRRLIGEDVILNTMLGDALRTVRVDRGQIELVFLNLVVNARDAMPQGGTLTIETANVHLDPKDVPARTITGLSGECVMLAFSDTGIGMDSDVRSQIFEPFFTTKEAGKGTGLGLSTSYSIIRQFGGDIWVYSEPGKGTTFKVYLPAAEGSMRKPAPQSVAAPGGTETILIVEDNTSVAAVMRDVLEPRGYRVLLASDPEQARDFALNHPDIIHLLLSDMVLQRTHGVDLARHIRSLRPGIRVLFVSGYTGPATAGQPFLDTTAAFLQKPFAPEVLAAKVREVLNEKEQQGTFTEWTKSGPG